MKHSIVLTLAAALGLCLTIAPLHAGDTAPLVDTAGSTDVAQSSFQCKHSVTVTNIPDGAKQVRLWLPVPQDNDYQTISNFTIADGPGAPQVNVEPVNHNKFLYTEVAPNGQKEVTLSYEFTITRKRNMMNPDATCSAVDDKVKAEFAHYLGTDTNVTITPETQELANRICGDEACPIQQARLVYDWVIHYGEYWKKDKEKYKPSGHGNTQYFMECRTGNCTDFHAAFMSLMRARGIPVRMWFGGVFWTDKEGADKDGKRQDISYHCWPEFYAPGAGWIVTDSSQGDFAPLKQEWYFGNIESRRVELCQGRDIQLAPKQSAESVEFVGTAYAEVDGQVYTGKDQMTRVLSYTEVK